MLSDNLFANLSWLPAFFREAPTLTQWLLLVLALLLGMLMWMLLEQLLTRLFKALHAITPKGREQRRLEEAALRARVDAIVAKIASSPPLFMGPAKPPSAWQRWLPCFGWLLFVVWVVVWVGLAWDLRARADALAATWAANTAANPFWTPAFESTTPGSLRLLSSFLGVQVVAVLVGVGWPRLRAWERRRKP
ncbi:MAG: hypothetical protein E6Q94_02650 [Burkholderiaceae bacterium]|nr:MAG: hypothetical protein E6Q94_02650 [Burkholderiaceae bacterium]